MYNYYSVIIALFHLKPSAHVWVQTRAAKETIGPAHVLKNLPVQGISSVLNSIEMSLGWYVEKFVCL